MHALSKQTRFSQLSELVNDNEMLQECYILDCLCCDGFRIIRVFVSEPCIACLYFAKEVVECVCLLVNYIAVSNIRAGLFYLNVKKILQWPRGKNISRDVLQVVTKCLDRDKLY